MTFWDIFKNDDKDNTNSSDSGLCVKIKKDFPGLSENDQIKIACIAGLLARVACADMVVHSGEIKSMNDALNSWTSLSETEINAITSLAVDEVQTLSGLENYKYTQPLNDLMNNDERYGLLESLFAIAAGDDSVTNVESEEIRLITQGLKLEHKHFISARATVLDKLKVLKND